MTEEVEAKFEVKKQGKLQDQIENMAYEWALEDIKSFYKVEELDELSDEQLVEIYDYSESEDCHEGYVGMVLRSMCDSIEVTRIPH